MAGGVTLKRLLL